MSRLQLALNVADLDEAIAFYSTLFGTRPAKTRPGYANFVVADPPLKLVLFADSGRAGTLNHLGIERESIAEVYAEGRRLEATGQELLREEEVDCCHAVQTKFWVQGPDGQRWENYTVLGDSTPELEGRSGGEADACCTTSAV